MVGGLLLVVAGCKPAEYPKELFTIAAPDGADYPVMLSQGTANAPGRPIAASSSTHEAHSSSTYSNGYTSVTITQSELAQSEIGATQKLGMQVRHSDHWVQIEGADFTTTDFSMYGSTTSDSTLNLRGSAR